MKRRPGFGGFAGHRSRHGRGGFVRNFAEYSKAVPNIDWFLLSVYSQRDIARLRADAESCELPPRGDGTIVDPNKSVSLELKDFALRRAKEHRTGRNSKSG